MRHQFQPGAAWETERAAGALLQAMDRDDERGLALAIERAGGIGQLAARDAWTEEKAEVLEAVAGALAQGEAPHVCRRLLKHLAAAGCLM